VAWAFYPENGNTKVIASTKDELCSMSRGKKKDFNKIRNHCIPFPTNKGEKSTRGLGQQG